MFKEDEDDDISLDPQKLSGFEQGRRNVMVLKFAANTKSVLVDDSVGSRLRSRYRSRDVRFDIEYVRNRIGVRVKGKATQLVAVKVPCRPTSLRQLSRNRGTPCRDATFTCSDELLSRFQDIL